MKKLTFGIIMLAATTTLVIAADPDLLQDVCVADLAATAVKVNGFSCKTSFNATDFSSNRIANPGLTNNTLGSVVTTANVMQLPGLNTLGVSIARIDYAPGGLNPPHTHPRATEIVFVLEGELLVGFLTTGNVLVSKSIKKGEVFVFPRGLVHFQKNNDWHNTASVIAAFNSQLPGTQGIAATLFASAPPLPSDVLAQAFQIDTAQVDAIKAKLAPK